MALLQLHPFHEPLGAKFDLLQDTERVADYGDPLAEYAALTQSVGLLDLSFRSRLCLTGTDRIRFLHGQVTNDVQRLASDEGCYAALTTAKAKFVSDLTIYRLADELLLDFEPGLTMTVTERLEKYIIADDVQVVDVAPHYGLLSLQGPLSARIVVEAGLASSFPNQPFHFIKPTDSSLGEIYVMNRRRGREAGADIFAPVSALGELAEKLLSLVTAAGGKACGWNALETSRIEAGLPRFGADMDQNTNPLEAGLDNGAISFNKGCYIGQEIISRIRTYSEVARALRRLEMPTLPAKGEKLLLAGKEVGFITSAASPPKLNRTIGLGYVRKESNDIGTELTCASTGATARIVGKPGAIGDSLIH